MSKNKEISGIETVVSKEEAQAEVIKGLSQAHLDKTMRILSDIDPDERLCFSYLYAVDNVLHTKAIPVFLEAYLHLGISKNRKGRRELLEASKSIEEEKKRKGALARLASFFKGAED